MAKPRLSEPYLEVTKGEDRGKCFPLTGPVTRIGRGEEVEIRLSDAENVLSRTHASLRSADGNFLLTNHGTHGTKVGQKEVAENPVALKDGDTILLGTRIKLRFRTPGARTSKLTGRESDQSPSDSKGEAKRSKLTGNKKLLLALLPVWLIIWIILVVALSDKEKETNNTQNDVVQLILSISNEREVTNSQRDVIDEINESPLKKEIVKYIHDSEIYRRRNDLDNSRKCWENIMKRASSSGSPLYLFSVKQIGLIDRRE